MDWTHAQREPPSFSSLHTTAEEARRSQLSSPFLCFFAKYLAKTKESQEDPRPSAPDSNALFLTVMLFHEHLHRRPEVKPHDLLGPLLPQPDHPIVAGLDLALGQVWHVLCKPVVVRQRQPHILGERRQERRGEGAQQIEYVQFAGGLWREWFLRTPLLYGVVNKSFPVICQPRPHPRIVCYHTKRRYTRSPQSGG